MKIPTDSPFRYAGTHIVYADMIIYMINIRHFNIIVVLGVLLGGGGGGAPITLPYSTDNIVSMQVLIYAGSLNVTFTGFKERTFLLESYLRSHKWGHLEMHMLLSEDIIHFNVDGIPGNDLIDKNNRCPELLVSLLTSRCPVGRRVKSGLWGRVNKKWE